MTENEDVKKMNYWEPKAGGSIEGIIQASASSGLIYDERKTLWVQQDKGAAIGIILNRYLIHSLKQHSAEVGDFIVVTFHGKEQKNNGRYFNRYSLILDKIA